jgi:hypothetical protein
MSITDNQLNYIKILSSYDFSLEDDQKDIESFLSNKSKTALNQLSKSEASELIQLLLERPTGYLLSCDTVIVLDKREVNSFHVLGDVEACLHYCPYGRYIGDCEDYMKYQQLVDECELDDDEQDKVIDFSGKKIIYIKDEEDEKNLSNRERFEIMLDEFVKSDSRTLTICGEDYEPEVSKYYLLYWIRQKYNITNFDISIKNNQCYLSKI